MAWCHQAKTLRNEHITNGSHRSRVKGLYQARREPKLCVYTMPAMWSMLSVYYARHVSRSRMTPVRRTYVVWGLYVKRGSAYVDLRSFSWHILSHQVNSHIINVSCRMIGCQWDSDDNKIYVILTQPFGIPVHMQGFPSCRKSEQSRVKAYLSSQM